jgi:hypothetical protein
MVGGTESGRLTRLLSPGPGLELKACMVLGSRPDRGGGLAKSELHVEYLQRTPPPRNEA